VAVAFAKLEGERRSERRAIVMVVCAVIGAAGTLLGGVAALVAAFN
jgi:hypothetical protein